MPLYPRVTWGLSCAEQEVLLATAVSGTISSDDITYAWLGAITKVERDKDGNALVYGKVTDGTLDSDDQIVDPAFAKKALAEWYETAANVRQMHSTSLPPAGKGILLESKADGEYVRTRVVEPTAIKLVDNDVYTGYSVGISRPRIERDPKARGGRIVGGKIVEISLVDRPANPMAKFAVLKMDGASHLAFIGKSMTIPAEYRRPVKPLSFRDLKKGARVSVDVNDEFGGVSSVEGTFIAKGFGAVAIDQAGFTRDGAVKRLQMSDIVAVRLHKAAGVTHSHMHPGPDGVEHDHEHTHASNHGDHSQTHAHDHPTTEDSVAEPQVAPAAAATVDGEPDADDTKAADGKCSKCSGSGQFEGAKCAACGGSGVLTKAKAAKTAKKAGKTAPAAAAPEASSAPVADPPASADPGPDAGNQAADADVAPGEPEVDPGPDGDDAKAAKAARKAAKKAAKQAARATKGVQVVVSDNGWAVTKNGTVIGTHPSQGAAQAQANAVKSEDKAAAKAAKVKKAAVAAPATAEVPWLLKRLHDYTCGAYRAEDVAAAYPTIEKGGVGAAIGAPTRAVIYGLVADEVTRDGGTGAAAADIASLGKSLGALQDLITTKADTTEARAQLHEAFKAANGIMPDGSGPSIPKPSETISPGQFSRGYISAGHQQEKASGHSADIPSTTHPLHASDFGRGPLTDGHQRYLVSKLADLHDGLADWRPELCRMDASGSFAFDRQPYPNGGDRPPFLRQVPNADTSAPTARSVAAIPAATGPGAMKSIEADVVPVVSTFTEEQFAEALSKAQEPLLTKLNKLETDFEALASQPDPARSAPRGVTGLAKGATKVEKVSQIDGVSREARQSKKAEKIDFLQSIYATGDPEARLRAQKQLIRLGAELD